jgi:hypothetical protein
MIAGSHIHIARAAAAAAAAAIAASMDTGYGGSSSICGGNIWFSTGARGSVDRPVRGTTTTALQRATFTSIDLSADCAV